MSIEAKLAALLLIVVGYVGSLWYAYSSGNANGANSVLVNTQKTTIAALAKRNEENAALTLQQTTDAKKASIDHAKELDDVRLRANADADKRVPIDRNKFCGPAGAPESTAPGSNGQAAVATAFLPDDFTGRLRNLATQADEVNADYRDLRRRADEARCFQ